MKLAVHVTAMNRPDTLLQTLRASVALASSDVQTFLTIVDNGSDDPRAIAQLNGLACEQVVLKEWMP